MLNVLSIADIGQFILDSFVSIFEFIKAVFNLIPTIITFIPNPFRTISLAFASVIFVIYIWKVYKGG